MARKRVVAYVRVSSSSKAQIHSYEFQEQYWRCKFDDDPNNELVHIYADRGISGCSVYKRPEFMKMLQDARAGQFDVIHTKSVSRFARNTVELLEAVRELRDMGIEVIFEKEQISTLQPTSELFLTIAATIAENDLEVDSKRQKWSIQHRFENGWYSIGSSMYGFRMAANNTVVIVPEQAEVVRWIYNMYISGYGCLAILGKTFKPDVLSKRRMKNTGQSPMYYAENTHPAIVTQEMFDMAQAEMQRRRDEKDTSVGSSRYTSKYPLSGLLVCGTCGHRLRRHVRTVGSGKRVAAWGCTNRISNGRSVCDSHHINEDVLERTIRVAFDGMDDVLDVVEESCAEVLEADNHVELERVQQDIITIQEAVLALHKARQQGAVSEMDYEIKIASYSQQMDELQARQRELKATAGRFAEVKYWMDTFKEHVHNGEKMDITDAVVLRQLTDRIVVYDDRLEIHLRIGGTLEQAYAH